MWNRHEKGTCNVGLSWHQCVCVRACVWSKLETRSRLISQMRVLFSGSQEHANSRTCCAVTKWPYISTSVSAFYLRWHCGLHRRLAPARLCMFSSCLCGRVQSVPPTKCRCPLQVLRSGCPSLLRRGWVKCGEQIFTSHHVFVTNKISFSSLPCIYRQPRDPVSFQISLSSSCCCSPQLNNVYDDVHDYGFDLICLNRVPLMLISISG